MQRSGYVIVGLAFTMISILLFAQFALAVSSNNISNFNQWTTVYDCDYLVFAVSTTYYGKNCDTGAIDHSSTDVLEVLEDIDDDADFVDGGLIVIRPGTYSASDIETEVNFGKNVTIIGYGATLRAVESHQFAGFFSIGHQQSMVIFGLTFDQNKLMGVGIGGGSGASNITPRLVQCTDCRFLNVWSYGISMASGNDNNGNSNATLIVENTEFRAGNANTLNEFILTNALGNVVIKDVSMFGNKLTYLSARKILVEGVKSDGSGYSGHAGIGVHAITADVKKLDLNDHDVTLRPYATVHFGTVYSSAKRLSLTDSTIDFVTSPVLIQGYNDTRIIDEVNLSNLWLNDGNVDVQPFSGQLHTKVKQLTMRDIHISDFNSNNAALVVKSADIETLILDSIYTPVYTTVNNPIRFDAQDSNMTISYVRIGDIYPLPGTNMITVDDNGSSARSIVITLEKPLRNGISASRVLGTVVETKKWWNFGGSATINSGQTNANVTHSLAFTPVAGDCTVTLGENPTNAITAVWLSNFSSTQFRVNVEPEPGASNLDFSWHCSKTG